MIDEINESYYMFRKSYIECHARQKKGEKIDREEKRTKALFIHSCDSQFSLDVHKC